jgi:predicted Zn-dependent protease
MYERSVGLRMAEIALHEVGHALGADHTSEGLMIGTRTVTLTDQHAAHYSDESAGVVRGAIESIESSGRMPVGHSH